MKKDFLTVNDFTKEELMDIINLSIAIKSPSTPATIPRS